MYDGRGKRVVDNAQTRLAERVGSISLPVTAHATSPLLGLHVASQARWLRGEQVDLLDE